MPTDPQGTEAILLDAALDAASKAVATSCGEHFCGLAMSTSQATAIASLALMKAFDATPLGLLRETYGESAADFVGSVRAELFHRVTAPPSGPSP